MDNIIDYIYEVDGKQVMLDSDVAKLYGYKTKKINEVVKRNKERFPKEFCFQLARAEYNNLRSQIATLNFNESGLSNNLRSQNVTLKEIKYSNVERKYLPYVFTEQGIAMLSGLLKNETAVNVSINIMNAFVEMRKFIISNANVFERLTTIEYKLLENDKKFNEVFNALQGDVVLKQQIFFEGQIYDAYSLIISLIKKANEEIIIIDNYVDNTILDMLAKKNINVNVKILTANINKISDLDINKFNMEYPLLTLEYTNKFHDRFLIIDNSELYHLGASVKDLGNKCFAINKMDNNYIEKIK